MSTSRPSQAISGVSAGTENLLRVVYPSISAAGPGRMIGQIMESMPIGFGGIKLSYLLFGLPLAPFALMGYAAEKIGGQKYVLTNRAIARWKFIGSQMLQRVELERIASIAIEQQPGQEFYHAADLVLLGADGNALMRLPAVPRAEIFRETILKAKQARENVESSLARIRARQTA